MKPIAVFYHALFWLGNPPHGLPSAVPIISEQMKTLADSGLAEAADLIHVGINGGAESTGYATNVLPTKAELQFHGLESRAENLTIVDLENWAKANSGWDVLYFHSKGATHAPGEPYGENVSKPWRRAMMEDLVANWRQCVDRIKSHDIVCSHWMWNMADGTQHIPAGNFLWVTSDFVRRLPSIFERERIKVSGIAAAESRYEAEVYWGNGPRPNVFQWRPNGGGGVP